jgi:hydroxyethylthiazole kinase-like sugar kinase family protein
MVCSGAGDHVPVEVVCSGAGDHVFVEVVCSGAGDHALVEVVCSGAGYHALVEVVCSGAGDHALVEAVCSGALALTSFISELLKCARLARGIGVFHKTIISLHSFFPLKISEICTYSRKEGAFEIIPANAKLRFFSPDTVSRACICKRMQN